MTRPGTARTVPQRKQILVVDDAEVIRTYLKNLLPMKGYDVLVAEDGIKAMALLNGGARPDVVVLDVMMPGIDGIETLGKIKQLMPEVPVIMLSVVGKAGTVVDAMNLGAADYINKPFEEEELEIALKKVLEVESLKGEREDLRDRLRAHEAHERASFLWASEKMTRIRDILEQVSDADVTILIHGESGVGKEVVARTTHEFSTRRDQRFVKVNCAALPEELLESELFGYERGAFTGASSRKAGKFEVASGGTMFLDEIAEMSPKLQAKLLQVLQDGEFSRLGGDVDVRVDVRVLAATNRNLEEMVRQGTFREDLYYRLNVVNVYVPPLRERKEEIPVLVEHFLAMYSAKYGRQRNPISDRLMRGFLSYRWPGNVRELENMVKRIVVLQSEDAIADEIFGAPGPSTALEPVARASAPAAAPEDDANAVSLRDIGRRAARDAEREALRRVLSQTNWNRKKAARILEVSYKTLLQKIKECGLGE
ncbi:MAG: sigma-54-dependent Fis family transcriptional regulator [Deltaproteobacteria bacterium]|nr:sigma-54-dependent Fis family transcriptional regulator [Deltaproteobacteria bacterium]